MSVETVTVNTEVTGPDAPAEEATNESNVSRPEGLPKKFDSVEAMAKSYQELQAKLGDTTNEETPAPTESEEQAPPTEAPQGMEGMQEFFDEYADKGELSEESYQALADKHNVPKDMVDDYIQLRNEANQSTTDTQIQEWFDIAGGEEGYKEMSEWALTNKSPEEIAKLDEGLTSSDPQVVTNTIQSLYINYMQNGGQPPSLIEGENSMGAQGVKPITSTYELTQLMSDPRYTNGDKAYHAMVDKRLSLSGILG
tara:strand:+ start:4749 stop:5510 length:762 start_codon:yes stop_codon:yes gene_type:complete